MISTQNKGKILNKHFRSQRGELRQDSAYEITQNQYSTQIMAFGTGCAIDKSGGCMMCDYGIRNQMPTIQETENALNASLENNCYFLTRNFLQPNLWGNKYSLFFSCNGSILNEYDFPKENLDFILEALSKTDLNQTEVIFGTHLSSLTGDMLNKIKDKLPNSDVVFEVGFETSNDELRRYGLLKTIDNDAFVKKVKEINNMNMSVATNIVCGCPFLSPEEQIKDTLTSVDFCLSNDVRNVVIFPMTDKKYTLLHELYKSGLEKQPSIFLLCDVLQSLPEKYLQRASLSVLPHAHSANTIAPQYIEKVEDLFGEFNIAKTLDEKKNVLKNLNERVNKTPEYYAYLKQKKQANKNDISIKEMADIAYDVIAEKNLIDIEKEWKKENHIVEII